MLFPPFRTIVLFIWKHLQFDMNEVQLIQLIGSGCSLMDNLAGMGESPLNTAEHLSTYAWDVTVRFL